MTLSLRAYAKHRGCSLKAVQKARDAGRIQVTEDGRVDVEQADATWRRNTDVGKQPLEKLTASPASNDTAGGSRIEVSAEPQPHGGWLKREKAVDDDEANPDAANYLKARAQREAMKAKGAELDIEERLGRLISAEDAVKAWSEMVVTARNKALMLPAELAPKLALETDQIACQELLRDAIYTFLNELAEYSPAHE